VTDQAETLWESFVDFCELELAAGGPDPHMRYVGWLSNDECREERIWRAGVYVSVYNTAAAEAIWRVWPWERAQADPEGMRRWIAEHWKGITLRRERRTVRTAPKLAECLTGYADFANFLPFIEMELASLAPETAYETMWREVNTIPNFGRYASFKLIEFLARYVGTPVKMFDVRAPGGFSPRLTLAMLMPEAAEAIDPYNNGRAACRASELAAAVIKERLLIDRGLDVDWYRLEVFLCDFRQSYEGERQYPGRSNDSELDYLAAIDPYWRAQRGTPPTRIFDAREALHAPRCRGELAGWTGVRKELGTVLARHAYTWSDLLYDYVGTTDLAHPKGRDDAAENVHDLARAALDQRAHQPHQP
jgi:hypothetical protein